jgi:hypothetical protein
MVRIITVKVAPTQLLFCGSKLGDFNLILRLLPPYALTQKSQSRVASLPILRRLL